MQLRPLAPLWRTAVGADDFPPWFQAIVCLLKYYKWGFGGRSRGQGGGKRVLISRVSLFLTKQRCLEHFGDRRREWFGFFFFKFRSSSRLLVGNCITWGLTWENSSMGLELLRFFSCAIKLDIKAKSNSLLLPQGRLGSELPSFPHIHSIALNFISWPPSRGKAQLVSEVGKVGQDPKLSWMVIAVGAGENRGPGEEPKYKM